MKNAVAVLTGWLTVGFFVVLTDLLLERVFAGEYQPGIRTSTRVSAVLLCTTALYSVAGGWTAAHLSPAGGWRSVVSLIVWGEIAGVASVVWSWGTMQWWYSIGWLILWIPAVWLGGYVRLRNRAG